VLFDGWQLNWQAFDSAMYTHYQTLIALRRQHAALRTGPTAFMEDLPPGAIGFTRGDIVVLANLSGATLTLDANLARIEPLYAAGWNAQDVTLAPHSWLIGRQK